MGKFLCIFCCIQFDGQFFYIMKLDVWFKLKIRFVLLQFIVRIYFFI